MCYNKRMKRHEFSDTQWERIKSMLRPGRQSEAERLAKDNRVMLNGIIYWLKTDIPWRDLPERFGPRGSGYIPFNRWTRQGV